MGQYLRIEPSELFHALFEIFEDEARMVDREFAWMHQPNPTVPAGLEPSAPWLFRKRDFTTYCEYFRFKPQDCEKYLGGEFFRWKRIDKFKDWIMILVRPERLEQETGFRGLFTKEGDKLEHIAQVLKSLPPDLEFKAMMCLGLSKPESLRKVLHPASKPRVDPLKDLEGTLASKQPELPTVPSNMIEEPIPVSRPSSNETETQGENLEVEVQQCPSTQAFFKLAQQCLHARLLKSKLKKLFYLALKSEDVSVCVSRNVSGLMLDYGSKQLSELPTQATTTEYASTIMFGQPSSDSVAQIARGQNQYGNSAPAQDQRAPNEGETESSVYARLLLHLYFTSKSLRTYVVQCTVY